MEFGILNFFCIILIEKIRGYKRKIRKIYVIRGNMIFYLGFL